MQRGSRCAYRLLTALLAAWLASVPGLAAAQSTPVPPCSEVTTFIQRFLGELPADLEVPRGAFALASDGRVTCTFGFGTTAAGDQVDPARTLFRAASNSKLIAATAVMQLVDTGRWRLTDDVNRYLPAPARLPEVLGQPVTLEHLLTHTAGFDDKFEGGISTPERRLTLAEYFVRHRPRRVMPPACLAARDGSCSTRIRQRRSPPRWLIWVASSRRTCTTVLWTAAHASSARQSSAQCRRRTGAPSHLRPASRSVSSKAWRMAAFVTAFDEHAIRAFEVHALDYLLKPVPADRLDAALRRAEQRVREARTLDRRRQSEIDAGAPDAAAEPAAQPQPPSPAFLRQILVRDRGRMTVVPVHEIDWIEADAYYVHLHTRTRSHMLRERMSALETQLDPSHFIRTHRSAIVRIDRVREVRAVSRYEHEVLLTSGACAPLSRERRIRLETLLAARRRS